MRTAAAALAMLLLACGSGSEEGGASGATPGSQAVEALEAQEAINSIAQPPVPTGAIRDAREAAGALDSRTRSVDSIVGSI